MCLAISKIENKNEQEISKKLWADALSSQWENKAVCVHGDIAIVNLLVKDGKLKAVIDFGQFAIGVPARDLAITWNLFSGESRETLRMLWR